MIQSAWEKQKAIKEVMVFLQGHGVSTTYAVKIFKQYGEKAIAIVTANPYQLAADIYGIGFVTADTLARSLGIEPGSEFRYRAGIVHVLGEAAEEGHCFLPQSELVDQSVKRLATDDHQPQANAIASLIQKMETLENWYFKAKLTNNIAINPPSSKPNRTSPNNSGNCWFVRLQLTYHESAVGWNVSEQKQQ
jgi:exodeoxyribonuclease V alpha subunit